MWEFYLAMSETAFRCEGVVVYQLQLSRRVDTLPITRDYMGREEQRLGTVGAKGLLRSAWPTARGWEIKSFAIAP